MAKKRTIFQKPNMPPTDEALRVGLQTLIANLIVPVIRDGQGNEAIPEFWDRTVEMSRHIPPEKFPPDMDFESKLMALIYQHSLNDVPPTLNAVRAGLQVQYNLSGEEIDQRLNHIWSQRTTTPEVAAMSYWLYQSIAHLHVDMALDEARSILRSPYGDFGERQAEALQAITEAVEFDDDLTDMNYGEAVDALVMQRMPRLHEMAKSGEWLGPSLKFRGFTHVTNDAGVIIRPGAIPWLRWGNTTLVTAKTGRGKTTFGGYWAEYNAWVGGFDVLYLHTETPLYQIVQRSIARNALYPKHFLESGHLDMSDLENKHVQKLLKFAAWAEMPVKGLEGKQYQSGQLHYKHVAGWNVLRILNYIATFSRKAAARGSKGVLVLVDYYNNIPSHTTGNTADQLGQIALTLRNGIMRENARMMRATEMRGGVHCIVFAQEANSGDTPYGSTQITQYSQIHITIERDEAKADLPYLGDGAKQKTDAIGNPRYLHRAGGYDSLTRLRVLKANEDERVTAEVFVENGLSRIYDSDGNGSPFSDRLF